MQNRRVSSAAPALVILILSFFLLLRLAASPAAAQTELRDIAISPDGSRLYFSGFTPTNTNAPIGVLDTSTLQLLPPLGPVTNDIIYSMAVSPDGSRLYVGAYGAVDVIDPAAGKRLATVKLDAGLWPTSMATSPDGKRLYVAVTDPAPFADDPYNPEGGLTIIDTTSGKPLTTLGLGRMTQFVMASSDGLRIYALACDCATGFDTFPSTLWEIDAKTLAVNWIHSRSLDWLISGAVLSPDGKQIYMTAGPFDSPPTVPVSGATGPPSVLVYDTTTRKIAASVWMDHWAYQPLISPDGRWLYLTMMNSPDTIRVLNNEGLSPWPAHSLTLPLSPARDVSNPVAFTPDAISPDGRRLYVVDSQGGTISVINTENMHVLATIKR